MNKTDKSTTLPTISRKVRGAFHTAKQWVGRRKALAAGLGVAVLATLVVVGLGAFGLPDWKVVDTVTTSIGAKPTLDELQAKANKDPKDAEAQLELAHASFDAGKKEQALKAYDKALGLDPKLASARVEANLLDGFGTARQAGSMTLITKHKLVGTTDRLKALARNKQWAVRTGAVATLDKLGQADRADWTALWLADLKEPDCEIRRNAVEKLGRFGDERALTPILVAAKKDDDTTAWYEFSCLGGRPEDAQKKILARR